MDEDLQKRFRRIESKVDAVLGLVLLALSFWCADRIAELLSRSFGWHRDAIFFVSAVALYLAFVFWYGSKMERR